MEETGLTCEDCGNNCGEETNCPYAEDVNNDPNVKCCICPDCYHERCMDI